MFNTIGTVEMLYGSLSKRETAILNNCECVCVYFFKWKRNSYLLMCLCFLTVRYYQRRHVKKSIFFQLGKQRWTDRKEDIHKHVQKRLADLVVEVVSNTQASYSKYFHIHI